MAWVGMLAVFWQFTADDAYIPARYGRNLADTGSFVFNAGERISAMTSPFEGLLATVLHLLFGSSVTAIKVLSVAAVLGSAIAGAFSLRKTPWMALGFLVTLLLSPFVAVWTVGGLETPFLLALVTALVLIVRASEGELGQRRTALLSVVMGIAFLVRYDSILFTGPLLVWLALRHRREPKLLALTLAPAAAIALAWLATAEAYFGDLFPTPFYVKSPSFGAHRLLRGGVYELQFLIVSGAGLLIAAALVAVATSREGRAAAIRVLRTRWWLAVGLTAIFVYGLSAGQVHMMFSFRLFLAYLPALALLAFDLVAASAPPGGWQTATIAGLVGAIVLIQLVMAPLVYWRGLNPLAVGEYSHFSLQRYVGFIRDLGDTGDVMERHWRAQPASADRAPRVYTFAAGIEPYKLENSYTYELLVGYRHHCLYDWRTSADYIVALWPRNGPRGAWIPPDGRAKLIFSRTVNDGEPQHLDVFFHRDPAPNRQPATINAPCKPGG